MPNQTRQVYKQTERLEISGAILVSYVNLAQSCLDCSMMSTVGDAIPWAGGLGCLRKPIELMGLQHTAPALGGLCLSSSSCFRPECFNSDRSQTRHLPLEKLFGKPSYCVEILGPRRGGSGLRADSHNPPIPALRFLHQFEPFCASF